VGTRREPRVHDLPDRAGLRSIEAREDDLGPRASPIGQALEAEMSGRWLLKTEPSTYAWSDLVKEKRAVWDGVSNAVALKNIRTMEKGDAVFVYHTATRRPSSGSPASPSAPYPDPKARIPSSRCRSRAGPSAAASGHAGGDEASPRFAGFELLRLPRLSVVPVSEAHWKAILAAGRAKPRS
jgi:predicted RNA-binding protein with PUA-like domain